MKKRLLSVALALALSAFAIPAFAQTTGSQAEDEANAAARTNDQAQALTADTAPGQTSVALKAVAPKKAETKETVQATRSPDKSGSIFAASPPTPDVAAIIFGKGSTTRTTDETVTATARQDGSQKSTALAYNERASRDTNGIVLATW